MKNRLDNLKAAQDRAKAAADERTQSYDKSKETDGQVNKAAQDKRAP